jgi:hypothetical protein
MKFTNLFICPAPIQPSVRLTCATKLVARKMLCGCVVYLGRFHRSSRFSSLTGLPDSQLGVSQFLCSTCITTHSYCQKCGGMAWRSRSQARWEQALQLSIGRLGKYTDDLDTKLNFHTFDIFLKDLEVKYRKHGLGQLLKPTILSHIQDFTAAITTMTQTSNIASLVWGFLQLLL